MLPVPSTEGPQQTSVRLVDSLSVICTHTGRLVPYVSIKRTLKSWSLIGVMYPLRGIVLALCGDLSPLRVGCDP